MANWKRGKKKLNNETWKKTKKELKAERELQKQKQTEALINSNSFVFDAEKMTPQSGRMVNLDFNTYFLK